LIPIANNLVLKRYKIGEVILGQGDDVDCMRIINYGRVKLAVAVARTRDVAPHVQLKESQKALKPFNCGLSDYSGHEKSKVPNTVDQKKPISKEY